MHALLVYCIEDIDGWRGGFERDMEIARQALSKTATDWCVYARYRSRAQTDDRDVLYTKDGTRVHRLRKKRETIQEDFHNFLSTAAKYDLARKIVCIQSHCAYWYVSDGSHADKPRGKSVASITSIRQVLRKTFGRVDALIMDCCLMATLENAAELHDTVKYIIASEVAVDNKGFLSALRDFPSGGGAAIEEWLVSLAKRYVRLNKTVYTDAAVLDLRHVPRLLDHMPPIKDLRVPGMARYRIYRRYKDYISYDLWQVVHHAAKPPPGWSRAFKDVVMFYKQTERLSKTREHRKLRGLSICLYPERSTIKTDLPSIHSV